MITLRPGQSKTARVRWFQDRAKTQPLNATGGACVLFGASGDLTVAFTPVNLVQGEFNMRITAPVDAVPASLHDFAFQFVPAAGDPLILEQNITVVIL